MPLDRSHDSPDPPASRERSPYSRRATSRADVVHLLDAAAVAHPTALTPSVLAVHRRILGHGPRTRRRRHWDTTTAALVAAASVDTAVEPLVTALRNGAARRPHAHVAHPAVAHACEAVALAGGWAWCALLCRSADDATAIRWSAEAGRATQRAIERCVGDHLGSRLDDAVGQACRSLVAAAVDADLQRHPAIGLPPTRLAVALGGLGAAHGLLVTLLPR